MSKLTKWIKRGIRYVLYGQPIIENKVVANIVTLAPNELLKGRTALITGGTSGIGKAIAEAFVNAGANVIITSRSQERAEKAASEIIAKYQRGKVYGFAMDNTNISQMKDVWKQICEKVKNPIDILVNNAGIGHAEFGAADEDEFDRVIDTNLKGTFFLTETVAHYMKDNSIHGNILNIGSSSSSRPASSAYHITKWGLRGFTMGLAKMLIKDNIVVNAIALGPTFTPMHVKDGSTNLYAPRIPAKRMAMPQEIANMAIFLTCEMGRMIVGDMIFVSGGAGLITYDDINFDMH